MRVAIRILLVGYAIAAILWSLALFGGRLIFRIGDFLGGFLFVMAFGYGHILIAALFLASLVVSASVLARTASARTAASYFVLLLSISSFAVSSWYSYFFFCR